MKRTKRLLALVLAASTLFSLLLTPAGAAETPRSAAGGSIGVTLRIDYAQKRAVLARRQLRMELLRGESSLGTVDLCTAGTQALTGCAARVTLRDAAGAVMDQGDWPAYLDAQVDDLPQGSYTLRFTGDGYQTFTVPVTLQTASQHITLGTGDATFTLGDLDGDRTVTAADRDELAAHLGETGGDALTRYDLSGDGKIDIVDLAYVARSVGVSKGTLGEAEVRDTALIAPVDQTAWAAELAAAGTAAVTGDLADLLLDNGRAVALQTAGNDESVVIPITLSKEETLEEIRIASDDARKGSVLVEYADGIPERVEFDDTLPAGVHAVSRDGAAHVVTVKLGRRVAVKKVTVTVAKVGTAYVSVTSIQFLKDIVPETPVSANSAVKNLRAEPGSEQVSLTWSQLPNVSGYTVSYRPTGSAEAARELPVNRNSAAVTGLENLRDYTFTVTPTSEGWKGRPVSVTATPVPNRAPDAPDMVSITAMDSALRVSWKAGKNAEYYRVFYAGEDGTFRPCGDKLADTAVTIQDLQNDKTYSVYVVAGNRAGESGPSRTYQGTPVCVRFERPAGIPTEGVLDYRDIENVWLHAAYNVSPSSYSAAKPFAPKNMFDGDFSTHWTSQSYGDGNWWNSKTVYCTFREPQDLSSVIWVPRLDGGYPSNLRVYTVSVWQDGDDLTQPGRLIVPDPAVGSGGDAKTWRAVQNNPAATKFAVLPLGEVRDVVKLAITIEQVGYTAVSLSELMFLKYDPAHSLPDDIEALFADTLHTRLQSGVTQQQIDALRQRLQGDERCYYLHLDAMEDALKLAEELLEGQSQGVLLQGVASRSAAADRSQYGQSGSELQPLGVAAQAGQELTVYAEGIPAGGSVRLVATQYNAEASAWQAELGTLQNGVNYLTVPKIGSQNTMRGGSLYLTYSGAGAENIRLHIRRGTAMPVLELSHWYGMSEAARKDAIGAYLDALRAYPAQAGVDATNWQTNCFNVTELSLPSVLLSLPAQAVLDGAAYAAGQNSRAEAVQTIYDSVLAWEDVMHICNTTQGIDKTYAQSDMTTRQNIRCMQMFAGAFMYAAGSHIGIGYGSCAGMVRGAPVAALPAGATANRLFGWGIAHEIGHNMDKLGRAEITNNIYSLMVQTYDGGQNTLPSRLETSGKYSQIFAKVAQGYPGASNDVFVQLGLYWQLHLAYDGGDAPMDFYSRFFRAWKDGTYFGGATGYDDRVARTASAVAGKDLTEFFTRWGMTLSADTRAALAQYGAEPRALWYLSDQSRRARLEGVAAAAGSITARAARRDGSDTDIEITVDRGGVTGTLQGYEIRRNGVPIGFTADGRYTDVIGTANHRTYAYTVQAYDILGNPVGAPADAGEVRVAYDAAVDRAAYTVARDGDTVTFTLREETAVSGIKLTGANRPATGSFTLQVTDAAGTVHTARTGSFGAADNQAADTAESFLAYFRKPGTQDSRIWTYDAKTVTVTGIPASVADEEIQLISYAGDDVSLLDGCFAGRLRDDYVYGENGEKIDAGTLVIVGNYRGDPVYNGVKVQGRFTTTALDENGDVTVATEERDLDGYALLLAEIPEDGAVSDISDGLFLFVPNVQREAELQGESHCDGVNLLPSMLRVELFRTDTPGDVTSRRVTAQTLWVSAPGGEDLPVIVLEGDENA